MKIFLAGSGSDLLVKLGAPYILQSYYDMRKWNDSKIRETVQEPDMFLLDSGAFTFMHTGATVDWNKYLGEYIEFINKWNIKYFFELDVDVMIGLEAVEKMTARLERETGKKAIPVFHQCRGIDWYREACKRYDYIAIGASALTTETRWTRSQKALRYLIKIAHDSGARVHGLGYTRVENINNTTVPFDSVDSTTCWAGSRYAAVFKFNGHEIKRKDFRHSIKSGEELNEHNVAEWVKMCNYKAQGDNW